MYHVLTTQRNPLHCSAKNDSTVCPKVPKSEFSMSLFYVKRIILISLIFFHFRNDSFGEHLEYKSKNELNSRNGPFRIFAHWRSVSRPTAEVSVVGKLLVVHEFGRLEVELVVEVLEAHVCGKVAEHLVGVGVLVKFKLIFHGPLAPLKAVVNIEHRKILAVLRERDLPVVRGDSELSLDVLVVGLEPVVVAVGFYLDNELLEGLVQHPHEELGVEKVHLSGGSGTHEVKLEDLLVLLLYHHIELAG